MHRKLLALLVVVGLVAGGASVVSGDHAAPVVADTDVAHDVDTDGELDGGAGGGGSCDGVSTQGELDGGAGGC